MSLSGVYLKPQFGVYGDQVLVSRSFHETNNATLSGQTSIGIETNA